MIPSPSTEFAACEWLARAVPYALVAVDQERTISFANSAAERLFEYEPGELLGQPLEQLIPESLRAAHACALDTYLTQPKPRNMGDGRDLSGRKKNGAVVRVEVALNPVSTPQGAITLASIMDVTERTRRQDELERRNHDLEQFAYVASHDLKEPLRMVSSFLSLLADKYRGQLDQDAQRYIHFAVDGAGRMQRQIQGLLAYSRVGSHTVSHAAVDCSVTLRATLLNLTRAIEDSSARIEADHLPCVLGDTTLLQQLFQNLIDNAIKFRGDKPLHISISATAQAGATTIHFQDNGIGFDMKHRTRVFEMFNRLHEIGKYDGSGMGLAIAKRIVELHHGEITIDAAPNAGCCVHVTLPLARPSTSVASSEMFRL